MHLSGTSVVVMLVALWLAWRVFRMLLRGFFRLIVIALFALAAAVLFSRVARAEPIGPSSPPVRSACSRTLFR